MARSAPVPAFFQVLVGDFSEKLKMPTSFVNNFNGPTLCKLRGPNGKCWDVKLEEKKFHHALLELVLEEGALVCPETGHRFPVSKEIPNMLLHEDEL